VRRGDRIGRVRWRLWKMLVDAGFPIPGPEYLWMQEGSCRQSDGARWGCSMPNHQSLYSWDKMTDCVRHGFASDPPDHVGSIQIHANEPTTLLNNSPNPSNPH
jgi:hypothetical protein